MVVRRTEAGTSWSDLARLDPLAAVLDSADVGGTKNRLIDSVHKAALRRALGSVRNKVVLDFGCGTGRLCEWFVGRGAEVHGVDVTPEMVDVARRRVPGADIRVIDDSTLPFPGDRFDLVITAGVLQYYVHDDRAAIRELERVLRPDGRLFSIEQVADEDIGRGGSLRDYERMFRDSGLSIIEARMVRLGDSYPMAKADRHPPVARLPGLPRLVQWEAQRRRDRPLTGGRYADVLFVAGKGREWGL